MHKLNVSLNNMHISTASASENISTMCLSFGKNILHHVATWLTEFSSALLLCVIAEGSCEGKV